MYIHTPLHNSTFKGTGMWLYFRVYGNVTASERFMRCVGLNISSRMYICKCTNLHCCFRLPFRFMQTITSYK